MDKMLHYIPHKIAKQLGLKKYCSGTICKNGNIDERLTSCKKCRCALCMNDYNKEYKRQYRKDINHSRELSKNRHEKRRDAANAKHREWYYKNHSRNIEYARSYYKENREKCIASSLKYQNENKESFRNRQKAYKKENKDRVYKNNSKRRAARIRAMPAWFSELDDFVIQESYSLAIDRFESTGFKWDVDHIIPLHCETASGLHCCDNIQVIPSILNRKKLNKMIYTPSLSWLKDCL